MTTGSAEARPLSGRDSSTRALLGGRGAGRAAKNSLATVLVWLAFAITLTPLLWIMWTVVSNGIGPILHAGWWTTDQTGALPPPFDQQVHGALHAIIGTVEMALLCSAIAVPIAIGTAIYLVEYGRGRLARVVSFTVDVLTGIPSIVAALFVFAVWVTTFGLRLIPACASFALVLLMIPVVTRSTEEMLRIVPGELREASYALGVPKRKTILGVVLPLSRSGIITGALLGFARVAGETAPLLILAAYTPFTNADPFSGTMAALPTLINNQYQLMGNPTVAHRIWGAALTLILLVMALNIGARALTALTSKNRTR